MSTLLNEQKIIEILHKSGALSSSSIHKELCIDGATISFVTTKRHLSNMVKRGILITQGNGPSVTYTIGIAGRLFFDVDAHTYCLNEPDKRFGSGRYNFDLFQKVPIHIFSDIELMKLDEATTLYKQRTSNLTPIIEKKELERLVIELSWKSSRIEGNTYTLLDTEKLILENSEAPGHDHMEATMILNHKAAFSFVREHAAEFLVLNRANLEKLHSIIVNDMNVGLGFRTSPVGVLGSMYRPLENVFQLREGVDDLSQTLVRVQTPYEKAMFALLGISYLQPFEDGNKRTSRLFANAILLAHGCAPLSYRSVDENEYREAMLVFYELNSIVPFKKIFIEQYKFAAQNYAVK